LADVTVPWRSCRFEDAAVQLKIKYKFIG
jgi:hypothetical protein